MKKREAVLFVLLVAICVVVVSMAASAPEEEPRLPVSAVCSTQTGHTQEARFAKGWAKTLEDSTRIQPAKDGESYLMLYATVEFDHESEKLSVMYEAFYLMPGLHGMALNVYSSLEVIGPHEFKKNQEEKLNRMIDVFYVWAQIAAPIFRGVLDPPCAEPPPILHTRG